MTTDLEALRASVAARLGLWVDDAQLGALEDILQRRCLALGVAAGPYVSRLGEDGPPDELRAIAESLTVTETYFFRGEEQLRAFSERVLPEVARRTTRPVRILCAACASGEEPYSIAVLSRMAMTEVSITAVDINRAALARARRARYSAWSLRATSTELRDRWFTRDGQDYVLDPKVAAHVTFLDANLADGRSELWLTDRYDVIFCRNMMMYFSQAQARALVDRLARSLVPGGYLFLGHAETLRGLSHDFRLEHGDGAFYYRRHLRSPAAPTTATPPLAAAALVGGGEDQSWVEVVQSAARRIEALAERGGRAPAATPARTWDLAPSLELLRRERFDDALEVVAGLPAGAERDADVLLLRAVLLIHSARAEEAERVCAQILELDALDAGAYYVRALASELAADLLRAVEHDEMAAHLDPQFAMPRLHLGLLHTRQRRPEDARRELSRALELLVAEDASRLLLFGGGFGRDALIALCQRQLAALGGPPCLT